MPNDPTTGVKLRPAKTGDLAFARELTRVNMRDYYARHALVWQPDAFDAEWPLRQTFVISKGCRAVGFVGLTVEAHYLYVRDIQLMEPYRGEGIGGWIMGRVLEMAQEQDCRLIRLKVFKGNPAIELYRRWGFTIIGEDAALYWMERPELP
jgi:GNAT superfamily N-acetyltransferase